MPVYEWRFIPQLFIAQLYLLQNWHLTYHFIYPCPHSIHFNTDLIMILLILVHLHFMIGILSLESWLQNIFHMACWGLFQRSRELKQGIVQCNLISFCIEWWVMTSGAKHCEETHVAKCNLPQTKASSAHRDSIQYVQTLCVFRQCWNGQGHMLHLVNYTDVCWNFVQAILKCPYPVSSRRWATAHAVKIHQHYRVLF